MRRLTGFLRLAALAAALGLAASAHSETYPDRPIRYIVGFPPGGPSDILARLIAPRLGRALGQPVVVENHPGAAGSIGSAILAKSPPDGYTIGSGTISSHAINATLYAKLPYDPVRDFAPITMLATLPNMLVVNPKLGVRNVADLIALLKARPGKYSYGSGGNGTSEHLAGELFKKLAGVQMEHVPYRGSGPLVPDLISGIVPVGFVNITAAFPHVKSGELRALAVTSANRSPAAPGTPTLAEAGLAGYEITGWQALFAPAGTQKRVIARLYGEVAKILRDPEVAARIRKLGAEPGGMRPADLARVVRTDISRLGRIVKTSGAHVD